MTRLIWTDPAPPTEGVSFYDHCTAESPIGQYRVEWKSWKKYDTYCVYGPADFFDGAPSTLDEAKKSAEAHLAHIAAALNP